MNLYFVRHGKAEPSSVFKKDKERELTTEGIHILESSVELWKTYITTPEYILTSPLIRAVQTGEIISKVIEFKGVIMKENSLAPGGSINSLFEFAKSLEAENIVFVGHQPDLSFYVSRFIGNTEINLKFSPGTIAKVHFEGKPKSGNGELVFLLPPISH